MNWGSQSWKGVQTGGDCLEARWMAIILGERRWVGGDVRRRTTSVAEEGESKGAGAGGIWGTVDAFFGSLIEVV